MSGSSERPEDSVQHPQPDQDVEITDEAVLRSITGGSGGLPLNINAPNLTTQPPSPRPAPIPVIPTPHPPAPPFTPPVPVPGPPIPVIPTPHPPIPPSPPSDDNFFY